MTQKVPQGAKIKLNVFLFIMVEFCFVLFFSIKVKEAK